MERSSSSSRRSRSSSSSSSGRSRRRRSSASTSSSSSRTSRTSTPFASWNTDQDSYDSEGDNTSGSLRDSLGEDSSDMGEVRVAFYPSRSATFHVFPGQSRRGTDVLIAGGFRYTRRSDNAVVWRCSARNSGCKASVLFNSSTSDSSPCLRAHPHNHHPDESAADVLALVGSMKTVGRSDPLRPAMSIVEDELLKFRDRLPYDTLPHVDVLKRNVNRARASLRPPEPRNLNFDLSLSTINAENFLVADLRAAEYRHVVFGTEEQLCDLAASDSWFLDGTFKVVGSPFYQLFSIHSFTEYDGHRVKQFPRVFVLMSRRRTSDYELVLR